MNLKNLKNIYVNNFVNQVSIYPTHPPKLELWETMFSVFLGGFSQGY